MLWLSVPKLLLLLPLCAVGCSVVIHILDDHGQQLRPPMAPVTASLAAGKWYACDTAGQRSRAAAGQGGIARVSIDAFEAFGG
jgi:hypothetical protein